MIPKFFFIHLLLILFETRLEIKHLMKEKLRLETLMVMEAKDQKKNTPHVLPIYASSAFGFENIEHGIEVFKDPASSHIYSRFANPTVDTVAKKIADLESYGIEGEHFALLCNSGMSAIHTLLTALLKTGDTILTQANIYGGSSELMTKVLGDFGVKTIFTDLRDLDTVDNYLNNDPSIRVIYFETPANPTLSCVDMKSLVQLAKSYNCLSVSDNTFASPALQRPLDFGVDFVLHSTTKYLNGHGNGMGGAIIGKQDYYQQVWGKYKLIGTNPSPFESWLLHNGLKTLALRMEKHSDNAMSLATFLDKHPKVSVVNYPGLSSHPDHSIAKSQMSKFGGMMSFELKGGLEEGKRLMNGVKICKLVPTLGNVDSLILHPASMSHLHVDKELRLKAGITDGLIRLSVGIEHIEDLKADLGQALDAL